MAVRYTIDSLQHLLQIEITGEFSREEFLCLLESLGRDPKVESTLKRLTLLDAERLKEFNSDTVRTGARLALSTSLGHSEMSR